MKIILKFDDEPELPIDVLPSVAGWAQRDNNDLIAAKFEMTSGIYWAYKYLTKTGTKVVGIRTERKEKKLTKCEKSTTQNLTKCDFTEEEK